MANSSRRGFLRAASVTAVGLTILKRMPSWAAAGPAVGGSVQVWSTFRDRRHVSTQPLTWQPVTTAIAADAIMLNPAETRQEMLGFGAAFTDAACYMLNQLSPDNRATLMRELFAPDQMALSVCRTCIGASDYSKSLYSFDDSEQDDPELKEFSIDHDKAFQSTGVFP